MRLPDPARIGLPKLRPGKIAKDAVALLLAAGVALATGGPAHADIAYDPGPRLPPISVDSLAASYQLNRHALEKAAVEASAGGDVMRARTLTEMADPKRQFLEIDPQGDGRAVEVVGNLATAKRIAVVVPGAGNTITNFDSIKGPGGGAAAVNEEAHQLGAGDSLAVIGWLGYDPPSVDSIHVTTEGHADVGAKALRTFLIQLRAVTNAPTTLLCHSYGSVVCGTAAKELPSSVTDIVVFGSPGMGVGSVSDLGTSARVWAGRGGSDGIADVPHVRMKLLGVDLGFGDDPMDPAFGAKIFDGGSGGHSDYLRFGSIARKNIALVALGRGDEATMAPPSS